MLEGLQLPKKAAKNTICQLAYEDLRQCIAKKTQKEDGLISNNKLEPKSKKKNTACMLAHLHLPKKQSKTPHVI